MNIRKQKKSSYHKGILIISLILIAVIAVIVAFVLQSTDKQDTNKPQEPAAETVETPPHKSRGSEPSSVKDNTPSTDHPLPQRPDDATKKYIAQMTTSVSIEGGVVYVRGGINNAAVSGGRCYVELIGPEKQTIERDTQLIPSVATTDCKTIKIPIQQLSKGAWSATLKYTSSNMEGASDAHTFEVS